MTLLSTSLLVQYYEGFLRPVKGLPQQLPWTADQRSRGCPYDSWFSPEIETPNHLQHPIMLSTQPTVYTSCISDFAPMDLVLVTPHPRSLRILHSVAVFAVQ